MVISDAKQIKWEMKREREMRGGFKRRQKGGAGKWKSKQKSGHKGGQKMGNRGGHKGGKNKGTKRKR